MKIFCHFKFTLILLLISQLAFSYTPKAGDLFFQDLNCGKLCNAITNVTYGYGNTQVSHVGMLVFIKDKPEIIEAIGKSVHLTPLHNFLMRSVDKDNKPRVMVGRLNTQYQPLIKKAISYTLSWQGLPYNDDFSYKNDLKTFYCSQLIYDAFMLSNHNKPIFILNTMTFKQNGQTLPEWQSYFKDINKPIPEGNKGTNPGMMSRSKHLEIIYHYAELRKVTN